MMVFSQNDSVTKWEKKWRISEDLCKNYILGPEYQLESEREKDEEIEREFWYTVSGNKSRRRESIPSGSEVKNLPAMQETWVDVGLIPDWGRSPRWGHGYPLQYSCLGNPMDGGAWWAIVCRVAKSRAWLNTHPHSNRRQFWDDSKARSVLPQRPQTLPTYHYALKCGKSLCDFSFL